MKTFKVKAVHRDHEHIYEGTLKRLIHEVFGYTLECGHSWNSKIPLEPKSGKSLVKALNDSAHETRRYYDYYQLVEG